MMKILIILLSIVITLGACTVQSSKLSKNDGEKIIENIRYVKDKKLDLCFALIASRKANRVDSSGLAMAAVPCEKVEDKLNEY